MKLLRLKSFAFLLCVFAICSCGNSTQEEGEKANLEEIETLESEIEAIDSVKLDMEETATELDDLLKDLD